jgi:hypothetical protein
MPSSRLPAFAGALVVLAALPAGAVARSDGSKPITPAVLHALTSVPTGTLDAVGASKVSDPEQFGRQR